MENAKKHPGLEYKWIVAAVSFLMVLTALGFCSSSKDIYLRAITEALEIERWKFSFNDVSRYLSTAVLNLFFGTMVAKFGAKKLILAGMASLTLSCLIYAAATQVWQFYVGGCFLGIGLAWSTTSTVGYVVGRWFRENKGTVMGVILASNGLGAAIATQIFTPIIDSAVFGYRRAYFIIALVMVAMAVLILVFFRESPAGLPDQQWPAAKKATRGTSWDGMKFREAVRKPYFYMALICVLLTGACMQSVGGIRTAHLQDIGLGAFKATAGSVYSLTIVAAKILCGICYDKLGLRATLLISHGCAAASTFALAVMGLGDVSGSLPYVIASCMVLAFAMPLETIVLPLVTNDLFGSRSYAKLLGLIIAFNTAGYALGAPFINLAYDIMGTYRGALAAVSVIMLLILAVFQLAVTLGARERKRSAAVQKIG